MMGVRFLSMGSLSPTRRLCLQMYQARLHWVRPTLALVCSFLLRQCYKLGSTHDNDNFLVMKGESTQCCND